MKCLKTIVLLLFCGTMALGQNSLLIEKVNAKRKSGTKFVKSSLFSKNAVTLRSATLDQFVEDYTNLTVNQKELKSLLQEGHEALWVDIPFKDQILSLELVKAELYADGFTVRTSDNPNAPYPYEKGVYYQGTIRGTHKSLASFSVFDNDIIGVFESDQHGSLVLGKFGAQEQSNFIIYQERDLKIEDQFVCETQEPDWDAQKDPRNT